MIRVYFKDKAGKLNIFAVDATCTVNAILEVMQECRKEIKGAVLALVPKEQHAIQQSQPSPSL